MRIVYLTKCSKIYSAFESSKCDENNILNDGKFSFLHKKRKDIIKALKPNSLNSKAPFWRVVKGKFWEGLHIHVMPKAIKERIFERTLVLHPIMGMLSPEDAICKWNVSCDMKTMSVWREEINEYIKDCLVFNFLPKSFRRIFDKSVKLINFSYIIKNKVIKDSSLPMAYTMRYIVEKDINNVDDLEKINFLDFHVSGISYDGNDITVEMSGEGKYSLSKAGIL